MSKSDPVKLRTPFPERAPERASHQSGCNGVTLSRRCGSADKTAIKLPIKRPIKLPDPEISMLIEVRRVDIYRLVQVNDAAGIFSGQIYIEFAFPNRASDADLTAIHPELGPGHAYFPFAKDANGKPTRKPAFTPNAEWYLEQLQFDNLVHGTHTHIDSKVMIRGEDVMMCLYVEGDFLETLELHNFPFDTQDLTFVLSLNCRVDGAFPCQLVPMPEGTKGHISSGGFFLDHQWQQEDYNHNNGAPLDGGPLSVLITQSLLGEGDGLVRESCREGKATDRCFPTLFISVKVRRRPEYYITNVIIPAQVIVLFAASPISLPLTDLGSRTEIVVGLLITFQLFKFGVLGNIMPHVSYETLLDKAIHHALYIVSLMALENFVMVFCSRMPHLNRPGGAELYYYAPICSNVTNWPEDGELGGCTFLETMDNICFFVFLGLWLLSMVWLGWAVHVAQQRGSDLEVAQKPEKKEVDEKAEDNEEAK